MKPCFPHKDIHSHDIGRGGCAVINVSPRCELRCGVYYSAGIHPWHITEADAADWVLLDAMATNEQVVAIGETGLDAVRGASAEEQEKAFFRHIMLSERVGKPLIIHAVKTHDRIMAMHRKIQPLQPWIIHGFRGKPQLARELLRHGFYISLGEHFNAETAAIIPDDRLFYETDESRLPINEIVAKIKSFRQ